MKIDVEYLLFAYALVVGFVFGRLLAQGIL
jgi:hypothetical protein